MPTVTRVKGAHRVQPDSRSNRPMPMPPAIMPVRLPNRMAAMNRGTLPRWIRPPAAAMGSFTLTTAVKTYTSTMQMAVMASSFTLMEERERAAAVFSDMASLSFGSFLRWPTVLLRRLSLGYHGSGLINSANLNLFSMPVFQARLSAAAGQMAPPVVI